MQRLGIIFDTCPEVDDTSRIALMQKHGFEATFFMSNDPHIRERAALLKSAGIAIDNCHAPFDGINNMWLEGEEGDQMLARLMATVDCCALLGLKKTVVQFMQGI